MITRSDRVRTVQDRLDAFPVVAILGPRQIGKTTLAQQGGTTSSGRRIGSI